MSVAKKESHLSDPGMRTITDASARTVLVHHQVWLSVITLSSLLIAVRCRVVMYRQEIMLCRLLET